MQKDGVIPPPQHGPPQTHCAPDPVTAPLLPFHSPPVPPHLKLLWLKRLKAHIFREDPYLTDLSITANRWRNLLKYMSSIMTRPLERISAISQAGLEASAPPSGSPLALRDQTPSRSKLQRSILSLSQRSSQ